ncbi:hypothetical protein MLD38_032191 [Melastoma candidum]|uniref:Uncharacterized protein n=1 Tax=Melastoma candidum TaxID=119954 RepID=A0ACB9M2W6_9MYRT|nr:hypothetical protein MLD38_032191 [Melastoma candidum]
MPPLLGDAGRGELLLGAPKTPDEGRLRAKGSPLLPVQRFTNASRRGGRDWHGWCSESKKTDVDGRIAAGKGVIVGDVGSVWYVQESREVEKHRWEGRLSSFVGVLFAPENGENAAGRIKDSRFSGQVVQFSEEEEITPNVASHSVAL